MYFILNQLDYLHLSGNHSIGDEGGRLLIPCLRFIDKLDISSCDITNGLMEEIKSEHKRLRSTVSSYIITT